VRTSNRVACHGRTAGDSIGNAAGALHQVKLEIDVFGCAIVGDFRPLPRLQVAQEALQ